MTWLPEALDAVSGGQGGDSWIVLHRRLDPAGLDFRRGIHCVPKRRGATLFWPKGQIGNSE